MSLKIVLSILCISSLGYKINAADDTTEDRIVRKLFLKKSSQDLDTSASGYIYRQDNNEPASIVYLNNDEVAGHFQQQQLLPQPQLAALPISYTYTANEGLIGLHNHVNDQLDRASHGHLSGPYRQFRGRPAQYKNHVSYPPKPVYNQPIIYNKPAHYRQAPQHHHHPLPPPKSQAYTHQSAENNDDDEDDDDEDDSVELVEGNDRSSHGNYNAGLYDDGSFNGGYGKFAAYTHGDDGGHHGHHSNFKDEHGSEYGEDEHQKHGEHGNKGYNSEHLFSQGESGHHDNSDHEGHYEKNGGHKHNEHDSAEHYGEHHEGKKGSKGGKFGEKKHHKKGSKTTGYHNVFHKDEYKKDHTFYDDADHKGHFNKYGSDHKYHKNDEGKHAKGGHYDAGHQEGHHYKKGHTDKGSHDTEKHGYNKKHGNDEHHTDHSDYAKKGGNEYGNEHKYAHSGGNH